MSVLWIGCQSSKTSNKMNCLFLSAFLVVVCTLTASTATCVIDGKKDSGVQVIRLDNPDDEEPSKGGVIEIHIPSESRRKRETSTKEIEKACKKNEDCSSGNKCDLKTSKCSSESGKKSKTEPTVKQDKISPKH